MPLFYSSFISQQVQQESVQTQNTVNESVQEKNTAKDTLISRNTENNNVIVDESNTRDCVCVRGIHGNWKRSGLLIKHSYSKSSFNVSFLHWSVVLSHKPIDQILC